MKTSNTQFSDVDMKSVKGSGFKTDKAIWWFRFLRHPEWKRIGPLELWKAGLIEECYEDGMLKFDPRDRKDIIKFIGRVTLEE